MKFSHVKEKHNLTADQFNALCGFIVAYDVCTTAVDDWTANMTIIGKKHCPTVTVRHSDMVLHIDAYNHLGDSLDGISWALRESGLQYVTKERNADPLKVSAELNKV